MLAVYEDVQTILFCQGDSTMRIFLFLAVMLTAMPVFAQELPIDVPEMQDTESIEEYGRTAIENYRGMTPPREMTAPQRRPNRDARDIAAPRPAGQRWREVPQPRNRWGWSRRIPRRPMRPRYDWYSMCSGPYLVWIGRVQVLVPGNCY